MNLDELVETLQHIQQDSWINGTEQVRIRLTEYKGPGVWDIERLDVQSISSTMAVGDSEIVLVVAA